MSNSLQRCGAAAQKCVKVHQHSVEVLPFDGSLKYIGRLVDFSNFHDAELQNRVGSAWAKFACFRKELCNKAYPLHSRLRLFAATVSSTLLYGSSAWTLNAEREGT